MRSSPGEGTGDVPPSLLTFHHMVVTIVRLLTGWQEGRVMLEPGAAVRTGTSESVTETDALKEKRTKKLSGDTWIFTLTWLWCQTHLWQIDTGGEALMSPPSPWCLLHLHLHLSECLLHLSDCFTCLLHLPLSECLLQLYDCPPPPVWLLHLCPPAQPVWPSTCLTGSCTSTSSCLSPPTPPHRLSTCLLHLSFPPPVCLLHLHLCVCPWHAVTSVSNHHLMESLCLPQHANPETPARDKPHPHLTFLKVQ